MAAKGKGSEIDKRTECNPILFQGKPRFHKIIKIMLRTRSVRLDSDRRFVPLEAAFACRGSPVDRKNIVFFKPLIAKDEMITSDKWRRASQS